MLGKLIFYILALMKTYQITYRANLTQRIIATVIDYGIYFTAIWVYTFCLGTDDGYGRISVTGIMTLPGILLWVAYFVLLEAFNQATPGHDIMKLRVIKKDGERIGFSNALKRRLADWIDFSICGVPAFICIKYTPQHQRIGDLWAGTVVVKRSDIIETEVTF